MFAETFEPAPVADEYGGCWIALEYSQEEECVTLKSCVFPVRALIFFFFCDYKFIFVLSVSPLLVRTLILQEIGQYLHPFFWTVLLLITADFLCFSLIRSAVPYVETAK